MTAFYSTEATMLEDENTNVFAGHSVFVPQFAATEILDASLNGQYVTWCSLQAP